LTLKAENDRKKHGKRREKVGQKTGKSKEKVRKK